MVAVKIGRDEYDVRIDRKTKWGNPFSHKQGTLAQYVVESRDEAVKQHRAWLWNEIKTGRVTLEELAALKGKRLGCHCAPLPCHGDTLSAAAEWAAEQIARKPQT